MLRYVVRQKKNAKLFWSANSDPDYIRTALTGPETEVKHCRLEKKKALNEIYSIRVKIFIQLQPRHTIIIKYFQKWVSRGEEDGSLETLGLESSNTVVCLLLPIHLMTSEILTLSIVYLHCKIILLGQTGLNIWTKILHFGKLL